MKMNKVFALAVLALFVFTIPVNAGSLKELILGSYIDSAEIPDAIRLNGNGILTANGDGWAQISGTGDIVVSGNGYVLVHDSMAEGIIEVDGFGVKVKDGSSTLYEGEGTITLTDVNSASVYFEGTGIMVNAEGTGTARFYGVGEYWVGNMFGVWPVGSEVELA